MADKRIKDMLINSGLVLIAILAFVFTAELCARIFYPRLADYNMEMWRYAAYGKIPGNSARLSHKHRPGASFRNLYGVSVDINSKGLRDREYEYAKPSGCRRILAIGDSITFGWGVDADQTYPKLLEEKLNLRKDPWTWQVINAGVGNYQIADELEFLKAEGLKYDPDIIVLGYFIDDAKINPRIQPCFLKAHSYLYGFITAHINNILVRWNDNMHFYNYYQGLYAPGSGSRKNFERCAAELKKIAADKNIPVFVALIPELHRLDGYPFQNIHDYVSQQFSGQPKIKILDLLPYFDKAVPPEKYWVSKEDQHHNAMAQRIIMEAIYPEVSVIREEARPGI